MSEALRPCPFCPGERTDVHLAYERSRWFVCCPICGCHGPSFWNGGPNAPEEKTETAKRLAVLSWGMGYYGQPETRPTDDITVRLDNLAQSLAGKCPPHILMDLAEAASLIRTLRRSTDTERKRAVACIHWVVSADGTKSERSMADECIAKINDPSFIPNRAN